MTGSGAAGVATEHRAQGHGQRRRQHPGHRDCPLQEASPSTASPTATNGAANLWQPQAEIPSKPQHQAKPAHGIDRLGKQAAGQQAPPSAAGNQSTPNRDQHRCPPGPGQKTETAVASTRVNRANQRRSLRSIRQERPEPGPPAGEPARPGAAQTGHQVSPPVANRGAIAAIAVPHNAKGSTISSPRRSTR